MFNILLLLITWLIMVTIAYHQIKHDELHRLEEADLTQSSSCDNDNDESFQSWATSFRMF